MPALLAVLAPLLASLPGKLMDLVAPENKDKAKAILDEHASDIEARIAEANAQSKLVESEAQVILSEQKSGWLGANCRPLLMIVIMIIISINYAIIPIINMFKPVLPAILPESLWTLILISVPGYLSLRTIDKHAPSLIDTIGKVIKRN